jgi:Ca-activated chloride channel family protein
MHALLALSLAVTPSLQDSATLQSPAPAPLHPPEPVRVTAIAAHLRVEGPALSVVQEITLANIGPDAAPFQLAFPLGQGGQIGGLLAELDGEALSGELFPADEARDVFRRMVADGRPVAILEHYGQGLFLAETAPIPTGETRVLTLRYDRLVGQRDGLPQLHLPLTAWRRVAGPFSLTVDAELITVDPVTTLYSPTHALTRTDEWQAYDADGNASWHTRFRVERPGEMGEVDLVAVYQEPARSGLLSVAVLSERPEPDEPGYFLAVVDGLRDDQLIPEPRNVVFVVDRSGSMEGDKLTQAKAALAYMIRDLQPGDRFNVVSYAADVVSFSDIMQGPIPGSVEEALAFVGDIEAEGGTNIGLALTTALAEFHDPAQMNQVVFLTDGLPTEGVTEERALAKTVRDSNTAHARIIAFGLGFDVNAALLDRIAAENNGMSEYVLPNEPVDERVAGFVERMRAPLLVNTTFAFGGVEVHGVQPAAVGDLYAGQQVLVSGRYDVPGTLELAIAGTRSGGPTTQSFAMELAAGPSSDASDLVGRMWAGVRIGYLIDELRLAEETEDPAEIEARVAEIVELSTRFGILTEYTSFLAADGVDLYAFAENVATCGRIVAGGTEVVTGSHGVAQASNSKSMQRLSCTTELGSWYDSAGNRVQQQGLQCVSGRTLFRREGAWLDAALDPELAVEEIELSSPEFYALLDQHEWLGSCVARTGALTVAVGERAVRFVDATPAPDSEG